MKKDSKIWIIFKHEYKTKIRSKGFILSTILMPTGMLLIFGISFLVTFLSMDDTSKKIAVCDDSNFCYRALIERDKDLYYISEDSFETLKIQVQDQKIDGVLHIDSDFLENGESEIITGAGSGVGLINSIDNDLSRILRQKRLETYVSDPEIIKLLSSGVSLNKSKINKEGSAQKDNSELMAIIGYVFGLMLYMMMLLYGSMVMQSCMEEKANRIIEIIASSAKPMEIMLSKITAIGALGLTQLSIWVGSGLLLFNAFPALMSNSGDSAKMAAGLEQELGISLTSLPSIPIGSIVGLVFFFIAGYFIYATLFAAVGSAVDQEQDARQLTAPITMPLIIPILLMTNIMTNPDGAIATWCSIFPFFAPILMPVRLAATTVPIWQIALCVALLIGTFLVCLWICGKIYRVGIMITGTQPKFKDLIRWIKLAK